MPSSSVRSGAPRLGDLELAALEALWAEPDLSAKAVHERLRPERGIALNTVQSTLDRLYRKKLLVRHKQGHAFRYAPLVSREALVGSLINEVLGRFGTGQSSLAAAAFAVVADDLDDEELARLELEIARRRGNSS